LVEQDGGCWLHSDGCQVTAGVTESRRFRIPHVCHFRDSRGDEADFLRGNCSGLRI
jgi:hypothetical protein